MTRHQSDECPNFWHFMDMSLQCRLPVGHKGQHKTEFPDLYGGGDPELVTWTVEEPRLVKGFQIEATSA